MHDVLFVPLIYSRQVDISMSKVQDSSFINNQVKNHAYNKFQEYNHLAHADNFNNYPTQYSDLPDSQKDLAVRQFKDKKRIFGKTYECKTDIFFRPSLTFGYENCMQDNQIMSYMVNLQKWIQKHFRSQTEEEVNPSKRQ